MLQSLAISMCVCVWLHIQSAIYTDVIIWMYRYYIVDMLNIFI